jgi:transcriptional regulator of arginine metabolism
MIGNQSMALEQRLLVIRRLLEHELIGSQGELVEALSTEGLDITQATASRDLQRLKAVKIRHRGSLRYAIPETTPDNPKENLIRTLREHSRALTPSGTLLVVRTNPGAAQVVAGALDSFQHRDVIGTIAGDDTVLLVLSEGSSASNLITELENLGVEA